MTEDLLTNQVRFKWMILQKGALQTGKIINLLTMGLWALNVILNQPFNVILILYHSPYRSNGRKGSQVKSY